MADDPVVDSRAGDDDVARLVALTERQHELWDLLRDTKDEQVRNKLLDELTANREELTNLKTKVSSEVDRPPVVPPVIVPNADLAADEHQPRSVGEQLRSRIMSPGLDQTVAPNQPPPPPPPPPPVASVPPPIDEEPAPSAESALPLMPSPRPHVDAQPVPDDSQPQSVPEETAAPHTDEHEESDPDLLLPEKTPYRSRDDDLAATRVRREQSAVKPAAAAVESDAIAGMRADRRQAAHDAMRDLEKMRPHHPVHNRRWLFPVVAILIALTAVTLAVWYLLFNDRDTGSSTTSISTTTLAGSSEQSSAAAQIRAVVIGMGLTGVTVEERTGTIYLTGSVNSEADRTAAIGAAKALAGTTPIDAGGLSVAVLDDDLRAAALASISAAGFDKVNVSVSGGVATLTGVTPEAGSAELIAGRKGSRRNLTSC